MLYDPRWDNRPLLDQWIDWLETKDPDETYEWRCSDICACAQFYGNEGWVAKYEFTALNCIARGDTCCTDPSDWTFGKCLARAKRYRDMMAGVSNGRP